MAGCKQKQLDCTTAFQCRKCTFNFCTGHRLPEYHRCGRAAPPAPASSPPAAPQRAPAAAAPTRATLVPGSRQNQVPQRVAVPVRSTSGSRRQAQLRLTGAAAAVKAPAAQPPVTQPAAAARPGPSCAPSQRLVRSSSGRAQRKLAEQREACATAQLLFDEVDEETDSKLALDRYKFAISTLEGEAHHS